MINRPSGRRETAHVGSARYGGRRPALTVPTAVRQQVRDTKGGAHMVVLRHHIGDVLRDARQRQGRTLREVSTAARVSLGYLSEVERGQKEASSELLWSICEALDVPMSIVLREAADRIAVAEGLQIPDTLPVELTLDGWGREFAPVG
jgi:transcriptional regulator with XRE-family HTH domain